jgi:hypothetical protein
MTSEKTFQGKTAQDWLDLAAYWDSLPAGHYYGTQAGADHCKANASGCRLNAKMVN